jgi:hypothetical protein
VLGDLDEENRTDWVDRREPLEPDHSGEHGMCGRVQYNPATWRGRRRGA